MVINYFIRILLLLLVTSCTESYEIEKEVEFEELLVVEARITSKLKPQIIKITKTFTLEENFSTAVTSAVVMVEDDAGNIYNFHYDEDSMVYISNSPFQAVANRMYELKISTADGNYISTPEKLTTATELISLNAEKKVIEGVEGIEITANSYDPSATSKYYSYTYEKTYKVVAPYYNALQLIYTENPDYPNPLNPNEEEFLISTTFTDQYKGTCYPTNESKNIILYSTAALAQDNVVGFPVRFVPRESGYISYGYSIKVIQYVESYESYSFYATLDKLSEEGSVFSPNQPGFISGNLSSVENENERVIGFFNVVSESSQRIFVNHEDFFTDGYRPYIYDCEVQQFPYDLPDRTKNFDADVFAQIISANTFVLWQDDGLYYYMVSPECGDCSVFASPEPPVFWED